MARSRLAWWIGIPAGIAISSCLGFVLGRMWLERRQPIVVQETPVQPAPQPAASYRRKAVDVQMQQELPRSVERPGSRFAALNNRAIETLNLGEIDKAVGMFEECHAGEPAEDVFQRNLAEALARRAVRDYDLQHPCPDCIADLERAVELAPQREDIAKLLEHWRKEAEVEKDYWRESSQHFDLAYDGEKRELVWGSGRILNELEDAYRDLAYRLAISPVEDGRPRIAVVLYPREGFHSITGLGEWAGGAFDGTVRVPVGDFTKEEQGMKRVLRHELVHAFVRESGGPAVPGWLNEGLAQWLEPDASHAIAQARKKISGTELFPFERMQGTLASWTDQDEIVRAYAQSLVMVDYIAREYGESVLYEMIAGCKTKVAPEATFERATRLGLATVVEDLAAGR